MKTLIVGAIGLLLVPSFVTAQSAWAPLSPVQSPVGCAGTVAVTDSANMYFFGGNEGKPNFSNKVWRFDGANWTDVSPTTGPAPAPRDWYAAAYDSLRGRMIVFGGRDASTTYGDTWEWDGTSWTLLAPAVSPSPRKWASMAFDSARGQAIMFGGHDGTSYLGDTWAWDGSKWTQLSPATSPSARGRGKMVYNIRKGEMMYFAGRAAAVNSDTWIWNGSDWSSVSTATTPAARFAYAATYDFYRDRYVMFGGTVKGPTLGETWEFDGSDWTSRGNTTGLVGRTVPAMTYVLAQNKTFMFGGYSSGMQTDTWEYGTNALAGFGSSGTGCAATGSTPSLGAKTLPWIDNDFVVEAHSTTAGAQNFLLLGIQTASIPLAILGAPSCTVLTNPIADVAMPVDPNTSLPTATLALPNDPNLLGNTLYVQLLSLESGFQIAMSSRGDVLFGAR